MSRIEWKHPRITEDLRRRIREGKYSGKLPGERELSREYGVSVITMNKAVSVLVEEGALVRRRGLGTFVRCGSESGNVGIVVLCVNPEGHVNDVLYHALIDELRERGLMPLVINSADSDQVRRQIAEVTALNPVGMIFNRPSDSFDFEFLMRKQDLFRRIVLLPAARTALDIAADRILSDPWHGIYSATRHLLDQGHKRILFLTHRFVRPAQVYRFSDNYQWVQGYQMALEEAGHADKECILYEDIDESANVEMLRHALRGRNRPTAIVSSQDSRIAQKRPLFSELGLRIPDDLALVGYNNTPWCEWCDVPLSSVSLREGEIARVAVEQLQDFGSPFRRTVVKPELIVRASSMCQDNENAKLAIS